VGDPMLGGILCEGKALRIIFVGVITQSQKGGEARLREYCVRRLEIDVIVA